MSSITWIIVGIILVTIIIVAIAICVASVEMTIHYMHLIKYEIYWHKHENELLKAMHRRKKQYEQGGWLDEV